VLKAQEGFSIQSETEYFLKLKSFKKFQELFKVAEF
jgi:hypothetical protein